MVEKVGEIKLVIWVEPLVVCVCTQILEGICLTLCIVGSEDLPYEKYIIIQLEKKE